MEEAFAVNKTSDSEMASSFEFLGREGIELWEVTGRLASRSCESEAALIFCVI